MELPFFDELAPQAASAANARTTESERVIERVIEGIIERITEGIIERITERIIVDVMRAP